MDVTRQRRILCLPIILGMFTVLGCAEESGPVGTQLLMLDPNLVDLGAGTLGVNGVSSDVTLANLGTASLRLAQVDVQSGAGQIALSAPWQAVVLAPGDRAIVTVVVASPAEAMADPPFDTLLHILTTNLQGEREQQHQVPLSFTPFVACDEDADTVYSLACGGLDCDDTNDAVHPDATEVCNGVDDDCEGESDGPGSVGEREWYPDADGDGFGVPSTVVLACVPPDGFVGNHTDCDDSNAAVYPMAEEVCDDVDNDCDGHVYSPGSGCVPACHAPAPGGFSATSGPLVNADAHIVGDPMDDCGAQVLVTDVNGDGCADVLFSCPKTGPNLSTNHGAVHVFYGPVLGSYSTEDADVVVTGTAGNQLGRNLVALDLNSDGFGDVAMREGLCEGCRGTYHLFEGPFTGSEVGPEDAIGVVPHSWALAGGHDLTGDGHTDLVVYGGTGPNVNESTWVIPGPVSGPNILVDFATTDIIGVDSPINSNGGWLAMLEDANGDGLPDLVASGPWGYEASILYGPVTGASLALRDRDNLAFSYGFIRARPVVSVGDTNGDGLSDFLVGSGWSNASLRPPSWFGDINLVGGGTLQAQHRWQGTNGRVVGGVMRAAGDVDGDGFDDFLFTVGQWNNPIGATWLMRGRPDPASDDDNAQSSYPNTPDWRRESSRYRNTELGAGDINGDGYSDIVISELNHGQAFIYYGMPMEPLAE